MDESHFEDDMERLHGKFAEPGSQTPGRRHVCNSLFAGCTFGDSGQSDLGKLRAQLQEKDHQIARLTRQINKLTSVIQQQCEEGYKSSGVLGQLNERGQKRQGVSAESSFTSLPIPTKRYDKDFRSKQLIKAALLDNEFLKHLEPGQVREIIECMYPRQCQDGSYLIREGEAGSHLYVSARGMYEVIKGGSVLGTMGPGKAFGEVAILYNCTRTASIRVIEDGDIWVLDRKAFQSIMLSSGLQRLQDCLSFLKSVPLLANCNSSLLTRIADSLQLEFYPGGHYIIRQGTSGDTFFILSQGKVKVTRRIVGTGEEEEVRVLGRGDYFGEKALLREESRTANVIALQPGVECLTLDRESFMLLIGDLGELHRKKYDDEAARRESDVDENNVSDFTPLQLNDLATIATLGIGGFGRVELVKSMTGNVFALKRMKKAYIVKTHQEAHVFSERDIMFSCRSSFLCRLYQTFKDSKFVYLLIEACLGGEVWSLLRDRSFFDDSTACFITACTLEAIEYLHSKNIVFRDLKPENLLFDTSGYVKLADFGFAKKLASGGKTWTFCGTPEYVAPEIILNKGHDKAVDYWAIGVLIFELLTGIPPFTSSDAMKTYNMILKGIDSVTFPRQINRTAHNLIKKLCRDVPGERLGCHLSGVQEIKKHKCSSSHTISPLTFYSDVFYLRLLYFESMVFLPPIPNAIKPIYVSSFSHYFTMMVPRL